MDDILSRILVTLFAVGLITFIIALFYFGTGKMIERQGNVEACKSKCDKIVFDVYDLNFTEIATLNEKFNACQKDCKKMW